MGRDDLAGWHRRSVERFVAICRQVADDGWEAPTPCPAWNVRALVNHLTYENRWTVPLLGGATLDEVGDRFEGDLLGKDPVGSIERAAAAAIAAVGEPGALERTVHLSYGHESAEEYVRQLTADHLIHGWDLAVAIGAQARLDPELVQAVAPWFASREGLYRGSGAIASRVDVASEDPQDLLLAAFGRDPRWAPP